jgi:hypothetical protein
MLLSQVRLSTTGRYLQSVRALCLDKQERRVVRIYAEDRRVVDLLDVYIILYK